MHYDTIIIGGGSMGMPATYFSAKSGSNTLVIDQFEPPHTFGSHHGSTRIIRYAYGEGVDYVPLVLRAKELWEEAEQLTKKKLISRVGVLNVGDENSEFIGNVILSAENFDLPLDILTKQMVENRWPGIRLQEQQIGCYEPQAGYLFVEDCITAYKDLASKAGADFSFNNEVLSIEEKNDQIHIHTTKDIYTCGKVIVTVGAWANHFLEQANIRLPLTPLRKTFAWFDAAEKFDEQHFPCFSFNEKDAIFYGFPSINQTGLKIGRHDGGRPIDPAADRSDFGEFFEDENDLTSFLERCMPEVGQLIEGKTCMYSMTPDEDFIIDYAPTSNRIIIAAGFSGHGFKFASAVGEALTQLANDEHCDYLSPRFSIKRFIP